HQSCEGAGHIEQAHKIVDMGQSAYHQQLCGDLGLDGNTTASMGTAANMQYVSVQSAEYEEFSVTALVTAGVEGNAGCAGDPAMWVERNGSYEKTAEAGTINTMLFFNVPLSPAALTRAAATMTEAKCAVLNELAIRSRYSGEYATGTGTDQFCIAAPIADEPIITWTGKHSKIGELIGTAVRNATREALLWQNGLEPSRTRNIHHALRRLGFSEEFFKQRLREELDDEVHTFFTRNLEGVIHEPQVSACAYAIAALQDRVRYKTLPDHVGLEQIVNQASLLAATMAAAPERFADMRKALLPLQETELPELIFQAILLGWNEKWK
ncbi:hypothetical protein BVY04_01235, partial [bacterium M21]